MALITYDNKVAINENPSIPDINKVNASDMNQIKTGVNTNESNINTLQTILTSATTYSTTETVIGTWLGKPLYRKVYDVTTDLSSGITSGNQYTLDSISTSFVSNIEQITNARILRTDANNLLYNGFNFFQKINNVNKLQFSASSNLGLTSPQKFILILEYTKTTD